MTWLNLLYIIIGVALVLWGADRLTEGASSLARGMRVPEIIIGLTIVAAGTSAPELFVSLVSALKGTADLAVGNVIGSNIFNTTLIVGCSALVAPMVVAKSTVRKDIPFAVVASPRSDGFILLACFVGFMIYTFHTAKKDGLMPTEEELEDNAEQPKDYSHLLRNIFWIVVGLGCLIYGSNLFVDAATYVAHRFGVRQSVIGLTIVAGGTSLPELATSVVAAYKGRSAIAIGNVIGSNVFNILLILGTTAVISPLRIMGITIVDLMVLLVTIGFMWLFAFTKFYVSRREGAVLVGCFLLYMGWLFYLI